MKALLKIEAPLYQKQVVYRIVDFFSAASIVSEQRLMFSRADTFLDQNEGVERLLGQLQVSRPNSGFGMGWNDEETARIAHANIKRSHFVSCWSANPESVAMWSLYSPDYCSVRIATSIEKLQIVIENLLEKYSIQHISEVNLGEEVTVAINGRIAPVIYRSLPSIYKQVARRAKAQIRLADRYARKGQQVPISIPGPPNRRMFFDELRTTCNLKDISFKHEEEIRLCVQLGEEKWNQSMIPLQKDLLDKKSNYDGALSVLKAFASVRDTHSKLPAREFIECPVDLIESIAIDPRCPPHKANFMKKWFQEHGIKIVQSTCFGYIPDHFDVFPSK